jgi:hypothetical protein
MHLQLVSFDSDVEEIDSRLKADDSYYFDSETVYCFRLAMESCRLFITEDDTIGIAPQNAQAGDVVCIVKGAYAPCILRQIARDQWSLVSGDCYLCRHNSPFALYWNHGSFNKSELWDHHKRKGVEEDFVIC